MEKGNDAVHAKARLKIVIQAVGMWAGSAMLTIPRMVRNPSPRRPSRRIVKTFTRTGYVPHSKPRALELDDDAHDRRRLCPRDQIGA